MAQKKHLCIGASAPFTGPWQTLNGRRWKLAPLTDQIELELREGAVRVHVFKGENITISMRELNDHP